MLCGVDYWDGTQTKLLYKNAQLARIDDPGPAVTEFKYSDGRLTGVRTPLAADAVATGNATERKVTFTLADPSVADSVTTVVDTDATARAVTSVYDRGDRFISRTDPAGRRSTNIYDGDAPAAPSPPGGPPAPTGPPRRRVSGPTAAPTAPVPIRPPAPPPPTTAASPVTTGLLPSKEGEPVGSAK